MYKTEKTHTPVNMNDRELLLRLLNLYTQSDWDVLRSKSEELYLELRLLYIRSKKDDKTNQVNYRDVGNYYV